MNKVIKIFILICGICSIICGIRILAAGIMDKPVSKPDIIVFCIGCLISGIVNIKNAIKFKREK